MCIWIIDADKIEFNDNFNECTYYNDRVKEFLHERQLGICANKGVGKTFLLKVKRKYFQGKGILCLPTDKMLDSMTDIDVGFQVRNFFDDYQNWKRVWEMALFICIAQNYNGFQLNIEEFESKEVMGKILNSTNLQVVKFAVSAVLQALLHLNKKDITILLNDAGRYLVLLQQIQSGVAIFLDKIDQALSRELNEEDGNKSTMGDRKIIKWKYAQVAIVEAAYAIYNVNNHIKINYAIRPECFNGVESVNDTIRQAQGQTTVLKYTKEELRELFIKYIEKENKNDLVNPRATDPLEKLLGFSDLPHSYNVDNILENVFDYIYRHSFGTPRDLMKIGNEIYLNRTQFMIVENNTEEL